LTPHRLIELQKVRNVMAAQLSRADLQSLVHIVKNLSSFSNERDRRPFLVHALGGESPRANTAVTMIDLGGPPDLAAMRLIPQLADFGQLEYGKEALGVFLNAVDPFVALDQGYRINDIIIRYKLNDPVATRRTVTDWHVNDAGEVIDNHEKIIGENTLFPIAVLQRALEAAKSVVHIRVTDPAGKSWQGTGFLVGRGLVMTNHHVIGTPEQAAGATLTFNYQLDTDGRPCTTSFAGSVPGGLFWSDKALDAAVVQIEESDPTVQPLKLSTKGPQAEDAMTVIGHPSGHVKQISLRNNAIQFADARVLQYTASTLPGSSGSPLLDRDAADVIGIHHSGGDLVDPASSVKYLRNAGTTMRAVVEALRSDARAIFERL
jgi:V8-like Glu-specific endopeptidase